MMQIVMAVTKQKAKEIINHHTDFIKQEQQGLWTFIEIDELEMRAVGECLIVRDGVNTQPFWTDIVKKALCRNVIGPQGISESHLLFLPRTILMQTSVDTYASLRDKQSPTGVRSLLEQPEEEPRTILGHAYTEAFDELYEIFEAQLLMASPGLVNVISRDFYLEQGEDGVYAMLTSLFRNPPTLAQIIDYAGTERPANYGLEPRVAELASMLLDREVTEQDPLVLHRIISTGTIVLSDAAFDRLTDLINSPREPNQALIDLMKRRTNFKDRKDDDQPK